MITRSHKTLLGETGAIFSDCERYRYRLWRQWDATLPTINFLMLNPSTATETANDATVERQQRRANMLGFGRIIVTNLFAFRATDPKDMKAHTHPIGPDNDEAIRNAAAESAMVICAWGQHGRHLKRAERVLAMLRQLCDEKLHVLVVLEDGAPSHPLYVSYSVQPVRF